MPAVGGEAAKGRPAKLGRYELITQIGQGGMAEVQLALQKGPAGFEKLVVVKLVHETLATQKTFVDMLLDEARVAALVKHPNVVDIYDLGEADGRYFIAMEYLEGEPLLAVLRAGREGKRLDTLSTARLIADTAEGLDAAHELRSMAGDLIELVHHDVSLGNIVVLYNGQVKLVDFGVAKATMSAAAPAKIQGKFSYMAPEKLKGGSGDRRSDIWSLGCVLWEALTLRRLFKGGNDADTMKQVIELKIPAPSTINGDVIADFDPIVMRALERDPDKRYATAKAMAQDLEEVLRKQGYGGRNDQIAKYMQATFESHINARKKLLQEVSSKGRASADVLEAAFAEQAANNERLVTSGEFAAFKGVVADGTPSTPRSASGSRPPTALPAPARPTPTPAPSQSPLGAIAPAKPVPAPPKAIPSILGSKPLPIVGADNEATVIDERRISEEEIAALDAAAIGVADTVLTPTVKPPVVEPAAEPASEAGVVAAVAAPGDTVLTPTVKTAPDRKRLYMIAGAAATLLLIIIIAASTCGGGSTTKNPVAMPGLEPDAARQVETTPDAAAVVDPPPPPPADAANEVIEIEDAGTKAVPADAAVKITPPPPKPPRPPDPPPQPKLNATELTQSGLRELASGNYGVAAGLFRKATAADPRHAAAWRGLGVTYEKVKANAQAIAAFQRYLVLAPGAGDAAAIRERIEKLKTP